MPLSEVIAHQQLNKLYKGVDYTPPTTWYVALLTTVATKLSGGVEVSLSGYARQLIAFGGTANSELTNTNSMTFVATLGIATVVGFKIMDVATAGTGWWHYGQLDGPWTLTATTPFVVGVGELHLLL